MCHVSLKEKCVFFYIVVAIKNKYFFRSIDVIRFYGLKKKSPFSHDLFKTKAAFLQKLYYIYSHPSRNSYFSSAEISPAISCDVTMSFKMGFYLFYRFFYIQIPISFITISFQ